MRTKIAAALFSMACMSVATAANTGVINYVVPASTGGDSNGNYFFHLKYPALGGTHYGVDIWAPQGSYVYPAYDGNVVSIHVANDGVSDDYGNAIMIEHPHIQDGNGRALRSIYLHLHNINPSIHIGADVVASSSVLGGGW